jgi:replicative DNA helicase
MKTEQLQTPLQDLAAERTVIGALLIDPDAIVKVADQLAPHHFVDPANADTYASVLDLHNRRESIDIITVVHKLTSSPAFSSLDAHTYLAECTIEVPTASHVETYARIVKELALRRSYASASKKIAAEVGNSEHGIADLRALAERELLAIHQDESGRQILPVQHHAGQWYEAYCDIHGLSEEALAARTIQTGFRSLQKYVHLVPGNVMIVAGRTSMGKTALALDIALNVCQQGKTVAFFSYEMTGHEIMDRIVAGRLGVSTRVLQQGKLDDALYARLGKTLDEINGHSLFVDNNPDRSLDMFVSRARRMKLEHGLDLLVLDYLQLLYTTAKFAQQSRVQMVSHVSNTLKSLAMELNCPIIALAQLSRKTEDRPNKRPQLADLRESGEIEQDADQVLMLYREGYYEEDCENPNLTDVFIRKNRQGETGQIQLHFDSDHMKFREVDYHHGQ